MAQNDAADEVESPEIDATFEHIDTRDRVTVVEHMFEKNPSDERADAALDTPFVVEQHDSGEQIGFESPETFYEEYNEVRSDTKRFDAKFGLDEVIEGDRIDPTMIPRSPKIEVGDSVSAQVRARGGETEDREFTVRLVAGGSDRFDDVQTALVYDPEADLFARLGGHTSSGAWNQKERDWKVRDVGRDVEIVDQWDVEIPDLEDFGETPAEFVGEWAEILFDNIRHGDTAGDEIQQFDGKKLTLRDYDNRTARVQYTLE